MKMNKILTKLANYKNIFIAIIGGSLGTLAFAPYNYSYAILITLFTLNYFWYQKDSHSRYTFLTLVSLIFPTIFWIHTSMTEYSDVPMIVAIIALLIFSAYLSIYHSFLIYLANKIFRGQIFLKNVLVIPSLWILADFLVGYMFTGFPWVYLGYTQTDTYLNALAPIGGVYLITLVLLLATSLLCYAFITRKILSIALAFIIILCPIFIKDLSYTRPLNEMKVALVQGSIAQEIKWDPKKANDIFETYYDQSRDYFLGTKEVDLLVWPESAMPELENHIVSLLLALDQKALQHRFAFVTGIQTYKLENKNYYNAVLGLGLKDLKGEQVYTPYIGNRYYKRHLVPIGEKVPFEELLRKYGSFFNMPMSSFSRGDQKQENIIAHGIKLATAICYEIAYPNDLIVNLHENTSAILTVSNDGWFGLSPSANNKTYWLSRGPMQHANIAKMRALEFQKPVIRATNTGLSAIYDHRGKMILSLPFYEISTKEAKVTPRVGLTPFNEFGSVIILSIVSFLLSIAFVTLLMTIMTKDRGLPREE